MERILLFFIFINSSFGSLSRGICHDHGVAYEYCQQNCRFDGSCSTVHITSDCDCNGFKVESFNTLESYSNEGVPLPVSGKRRRRRTNGSDLVCLSLKSCLDSCDSRKSWKYLGASNCTKERISASSQGSGFKISCELNEDNKFDIKVPKLEWRSREDREKFLSKTFNDIINIIYAPKLRNLIGIVSVCDETDLADKPDDGDVFDNDWCFSKMFPDDLMRSDNVLVSGYKLLGDFLISEPESLQIGLKSPDSGIRKCFITCPDEESEVDNPICPEEDVKFRSKLELSALNNFLYKATKTN